jgi:predicted metal-dependent hydrolase
MTVEIAYNYLMKKAPQSSPYFFACKDLCEALPVVISKRRGARNMVLRFQPVAHQLTLTLPWHVSVARGLKFIEEKRGWVLKQLETQPEKIPFSDGATIPILGKNYRLTHAGGRGVVHIDGECIVVPGDVSFMKRRLREWIKKQAMQEITFRAKSKAAAIGARIKKISLRDTRSRWGSCSSDGNLSFSWRLIFAPPEVLDYLVAHEVAHLRELNHGAAFWRLVAELCPHWQESRRWIKKNGNTLYSYG